MPRRTQKLTAEGVIRIPAYIEAGATREEAATMYEVSARTLYYWLEKGEKATSGLYRKLYLGVKKADTKLVLKLKGTILRAAERGEYKAAIHYLEKMYYRVEIRKERRKKFKREMKLLDARLNSELDAAKLKQAELEKLILLNSALRHQQEKGEEIGDFVRESLEIQKIATTDEETQKYYDDLLHVPSLQEDVAAIEKEEKKTEGQPAEGQPAEGQPDEADA